MSRLIARYDRLFKKTHRFVPKRNFEIILEFHVLRFETIEKRDRLEERTSAFGKLFEAAYILGETNLQKEIDELWWTEEDARLNYFIPMRERTVRNCGSGLWIRNSTAKTALELAAQAKVEIARMNEEKAKRQVEARS